MAQAATATPAKEVDENLVQAYAHYVQGMIYDIDEQPEQAQEELNKAALRDPSNADLVLELTRRYLQQKQPEKALELLVHATALPEASGTLFARLGLVYSRLGKQEQAVVACQAAIKRAPDSLDGYRTLFFVDLQNGRPKDALKVLDQAAKAPKTSAEFVIELVELYATLERQAPSEKAAIQPNALAALNRAAAQNPTSPQLRLKLADDYNQLGDTTNAVRIYEQLLIAYSDLLALRTDVHTKLADIYLRGKKYQAAAAELKAIVQDDPANSKAYYLLGSLADDEKKFAEAADYFQKTLLLNDNFQEAYYDLARVQIDLNQSQQALATLETARVKFGRGFDSEVFSALAYEKQKDYTNAVNHFTSAEVIAKATDPKRLNGGFYFDQGAACERAGDFDQAEKCFEKSLELTPNFTEALNYLGYMWADRGIKLEQARDLIEKAVRLEPKSPAFLDSLGWVLYKLNRPQEALPNVQKAIEFSEEPDPTLYEHLGDIYTALKQTDKAREAWTKSLTVVPNDEVRKKLDAATVKTHP